MAFELPDVAEVEAAAAAWRETHPRFRDLCARYGDLPKALRHFGLLLWEQGLLRDAANVLTGAVTLRAHDAALWSDLAGAHHAAGELPQAGAAMQEALARDPAPATSWLRLGTIRAGLGETAGAEQAYRAALARDQGLYDAQLSLGLLYFGAKRFSEAAIQLKKALDGNPQINAPVEACYAQALSHTGAFAAAAVAFRRAASLDPDNRAITQKAAQAQFMADLVAGVALETAEATCRSWPGTKAADVAKISRQAFHLLNAYGHKAVARKLGEASLAANPADTELPYLLSILRGETLARAPDAYVAAHFDQFAEEFDKQLTGVLGYDAFRPLAALCETHAARLDRILDLGCGTGLAGPLLMRPGRHLTGIDLSPRMLDKARARQCYDVIEVAEAAGYLARHPAAFDLIFAADVLIYIGDFTHLMAGAARALGRDGLFALTIETNIGADIALMPSGRFAHALGYVLAQAQDAGFAVVETAGIDLRYETTGFVQGHLIVLRRA